MFLPSPPPCSAAIRTVAPRCLTPTPTRFSSHCPVSRQVCGGDSAVKRKLETRVRLLKELERERKWKVWGFKLSAVTQIMRGEMRYFILASSLIQLANPLSPSSSHYILLTPKVKLLACLRSHGSISCSDLPPSTSCHHSVRERWCARPPFVRGTRDGLCLFSLTSILGQVPPRFFH